ncbi:MAG: recombinase family protein [Oscillospiraceae bacterium]|nr:recombinase family protein [Oscillospiraceae bacterium]
MITFGYVRCSSLDQNEARQIKAMQELNIPAKNIYTDKQSGKDFKRPAFKALLNKVRSGDLIYCLSIDRLGRNYDEITRYWRILTKERGVDVVIIDMPLLDTRLNKDLMGTFIADLVLQILSFVSNTELNNIKQRQAAGIAAAKARGVRFGRPIKKPSENFAAIVKRWERGKLAFSEVLEQTGLKQATFYNRLREHRRNREY